MRRILVVLFALAALCASAAPASAIGTVDLHAARTHRAKRVQSHGSHARRPVRPGRPAAAKPTAAPTSSAAGSPAASAPAGNAPASTPAGSQPAAAPTAPTAPGDADLAGVESALLAAVNAARAGSGLAPLVVDAGLETAARAHTLNLLAAGAFTHDFLDAGAATPFAGWIGRFYRGACAGENLATGAPSLSAAQAVAMWLDSPGHRANLLSPRFTTIGVALSAAGGTWIATADFGGC